MIHINDSMIHINDSMIDISDNMIHITVSIGVKTAYSYEENLDMESIINYADKALYHAKNNGRNRASATIEGFHPA